MKRRIVLFPAVFMLFVVALPVFAQSTTAPVAAAATVFEDEPGNNGGGYGEICIGNLAGTSATRRAFVRFDLSSVPDDVVVTRVVYNLQQVRVRQNCGTCPKAAELVVRRVHEAWDEGIGQGTNPAACGGGSDVPGVDWNNKPPSELNVSGFADLPTSNGANITIDTDDGTSHDRMIDDVTGWLANPAMNFGWDYRVNDEETADNARLLIPGTLTIYWESLLEFEDGFESP